MKDSTDIINETLGVVEEVTKPVVKKEPAIVPVGDDDIDKDYAYQRQNYICQSQSINLFFTFPKATEPQDVHDSYLEYVNSVHWAGANKLKSMYYLRSDAARATENVNIKIPKIKLLS